MEHDHPWTNLIFKGLDLQKRVPTVWKRLLKALRRPEAPEHSHFTLTMVGGRGRGSAQVRIRRDAANWTVEDGIMRNARMLPLPHAPHSSHWMILDEQGRVMLEGRLRKAIDGAEVPKGAIRLRQDGI